MTNEVINGDCLEVMRDIPDETIDLVVTDPPYLMNYRSNRRKERFDHIANDKNAENLISRYIAECHRILKNNTAIYMFCSWHHIDFFKREIEKYFDLKNLIVWEKNVHGTGDLTGSYAPKHELVLFAHIGRHVLRGSRLPDVIHTPKILSVNHPTEKPVDLCRLFIEKSSDPGCVVFDGFGGVGTVAVAAASCGRNFICVELDERYVEIARKRLQSVQISLAF